MNARDDGRRVMTDARTGEYWRGLGLPEGFGRERGERIEFEDRKIAWAFTCMMRLIRRQSNHRLY